MKAAVLDSGYVHVHPDTHPETIAEAARHAERIQFDEPLADAHLGAVADVLRQVPDIGLRVYGRKLDPSLAFLEPFHHARRLSVEMWHVESFDALRPFGALRRLSLGQTKSKKPSLAILGDMPHLENLWIEGHARDFAAVGRVRNLKRLRLRVNPVKSYDALAGHPALERLSLSFGGTRNLEPLATIPGLRCLRIHQVRMLDDDDLATLSTMSRLMALELVDLRNVKSLSPLSSVPSLRFLFLEGLPGLESFEPLSACGNLEYLFFTARRAPPLAPLLSCPRLKDVGIGSTKLDAREIREFLSAWKGDRFWNYGEQHRGEEKRIPFGTLVDRAMESKQAP